MTKLLTLFGTLAASAAAAPAIAQPLPIDSVTVSIADLNLASDSDRRTFDRRITRAVIDLCGVAADVDLAGRNAVRQCRAAKLAEAHTIGEQRIAQRSTKDIQLATR